MANVNIETTRLQLRPFTEDDLENLTKLSTNPIVMQQFPAHLKTPEAARRLLNGILQHQQKYDFSLWAVMHKIDRQFIGFCGLLKQIVDHISFVELGYRFDNAYWQQGLATEAAIACKHYAFSVLNLPAIYSMILPDNFASRRVAEKVGLNKIKTIIYHQLIHDLYELTNSKFKKTD